MTGDKITKEVDGSKGRYVYRDGDDEAELTISILSPKLVIADHTGVPPAFEGQGIGLKLLERLIADAKEDGFKIVPLCPFVNAQRRRHPEWADLFQA
ncbi:GNAT family N-acetyltransferase [Aestuariibius sp. 2305UL40-4]|uniref:GNAT family N-acetyltransferase n=1 Tax=Aestuariibius violaceus TaxID=3234132 RepID=UPI00345E45F7